MHAERLCIDLLYRGNATNLIILIILIIINPLWKQGLWWCDDLLLCSFFWNKNNFKLWWWRENQRIFLFHSYWPQLNYFVIVTRKMTELSQRRYGGLDKVNHTGLGKGYYLLSFSVMFSILAVAGIIWWAIHTRRQGRPFWCDGCPCRREGRNADNATRQRNPLKFWLQKIPMRMSKLSPLNGIEEWIEMEKKRIRLHLLSTWCDDNNQHKKKLIINV